MSIQHRTFELNHRAVGPTLVIEPLGELDAWAELELWPGIAALLDRPAPDVVVDLRRVTFLDAGGLRLLIRIQKRVTNHRGTLRLVRCAPGVWRVLRITHLEGDFSVLDTLPAPLDTQGDQSGAA
ncbi:STAS domain-containing protein [Streptomyces sp. 2A115]|uniref:STAS domain-containing protein n=1 Tax=Streptomyces sp. 2A115 TaxID=3457439 RepID=UPI003FD35C0D